MLGYDYSARAISPAALKAAGCGVVLRYVSTVGNPKNITKAEYAALHAAGIQVGLVFETTAGWMLGGYSAGVAAAHSARAQATAAGYPADHAIWYAADFDTSAHAGDVATVVDCLHGCADAEGSAGLVRVTTSSSRPPPRRGFRRAGRRSPGRTGNARATRRCIRPGRRRPATASRWTSTRLVRISL